MNIHWKDWCRSWRSNTLATSCEELTIWKTWCWERLRAGGEGDDRGWYDWMASLTQWTWVWASFRSWWWTGKPGMLQSMGVPKSQTSLSNWTELMTMIKKVTYCVGEIRRQKGNTSVDLSDTLEIRNRVFLLNKRQPFCPLFLLVDDPLLNLTCSVPHGSPKKKSRPYWFHWGTVSDLYCYS